MQLFLVSVYAWMLIVCYAPATHIPDEAELLAQLSQLQRAPLSSPLPPQRKQPPLPLPLHARGASSHGAFTIGGSGGGGSGELISGSPTPTLRTPLLERGSSSSAAVPGTAGPRGGVLSLTRGGLGSGEGGSGSSSSDGSSSASSSVTAVTGSVVFEYTHRSAAALHSMLNFNLAPLRAATRLRDALAVELRRATSALLGESDSGQHPFDIGTACWLYDFSVAVYFDVCPDVTSSDAPDDSTRRSYSRDSFSSSSVAPPQPRASRDFDARGVAPPPTPPPRSIHTAAEIIILPLAATQQPAASIGAGFTMQPTTGNSSGFIPAPPHGFALEAVVYDDATHTTAWVCRRGRRVVVALRGTSSVKNLYADLNFGLTKPDFIDVSELGQLQRQRGRALHGVGAVPAAHSDEEHGGGGVGGMLDRVYSRVMAPSVSAAASAASASLNSVASAAGSIARHVPGVRLALPQVHTGFWGAYASIREPLFAAVRSSLVAGGRGATLLLTGHSLGGALAQLAAFELQPLVALNRAAFDAFGGGGRGTGQGPADVSRASRWRGRGGTAPSVPSTSALAASAAASATSASLAAAPRPPPLSRSLAAGAMGAGGRATAGSVTEYDEYSVDAVPMSIPAPTSAAAVAAAAAARWLPQHPHQPGQQQPQNLNSSARAQLNDPNPLAGIKRLECVGVLLDDDDDAEEGEHSTGNVSRWAAAEGLPAGTGPAVAAITRAVSDGAPSLSHGAAATSASHARLSSRLFSSSALTARRHDDAVAAAASAADVTVVSFGSPRVGNRAFARQLNSRVPRNFRVAMVGDLVPGIPKFVYKHAGIDVLLDPWGAVIVQPSVVEKTFRSRSRTSFAAHRMQVYSRALKLALSADDAGLAALLES